LPEVPPDDDDDEDNGAPNGEGALDPRRGTPLDPQSFLQAAEADRERAFQERNRRGDDAWRDMGGTLANPTGNPSSPYASNGNLTPPNRGVLDPARQRPVERQYEQMLNESFRG
jgi:hypothetical protein